MTNKPPKFPKPETGLDTIDKWDDKILNFAISLPPMHHEQKSNIKSGPIRISFAPQSPLDMTNKKRISNLTGFMAADQLLDDVSDLVVQTILEKFKNNPELQAVSGISDQSIIPRIIEEKYKYVKDEFVSDISECLDEISDILNNPERISQTGAKKELEENLNIVKKLLKQYGQKLLDNVSFYLETRPLLSRRFMRELKESIYTSNLTEVAKINNALKHLLDEIREGRKLDSKYVMNLLEYYAKLLLAIVLSNYINDFYTDPYTNKTFKEMTNSKNKTFYAERVSKILENIGSKFEYSRIYKDLLKSFAYILYYRFIEKLKNKQEWNSKDIEDVIDNLVIEFLINKDKIDQILGIIVSSITKSR